MGNLVEGGVNNGTVKPVVTHSPAVNRTVGETIYGTNNYANRVENYYARDIYQGNMMPRRPGRRRRYRDHDCYDRRCRDGFDRYASKTYEKAPPPNKTGEVLNLMKTDPAVSAALQAAASGKGFLGFPGKLTEQEVAAAVNGSLGSRGYDAGSITKAAQLYVNGERGRVDNQSMWSWLLGVPLAIGGIFAGRRLGNHLVRDAATRAAKGTVEVANKLGFPMRTPPFQANMTGGESFLASALGFLGLGGVGAAIGGAIDGHGDRYVSSNDIVAATGAQHQSIEDRDRAGRYYREICRTGRGRHCESSYNDFYIS